MKIKYIGENDHIVCFVGKTYMMFEKDQLIDVPELDAMNILSKHHGKFEKHEEIKPKASRSKVLAEVLPDDTSK